MSVRRGHWLLILPVLGGCVSAGSHALRAEPGAQAEGLASWYADGLAGHPTASGEPYDPRSLTAAHRTLPLGSVVDVQRTDTGQSVQVRVNDRGPYAGSARIIDLSRAAAAVLGMLRAGVVPVRLTVATVGGR